MSIRYTAWNASVFRYFGRHTNGWGDSSLYHPGVYGVYHCGLSLSKACVYVLNFWNRMIIPDAFFKYQAPFYCFDRRSKTRWAFAQQKTFFSSISPQEAFSWDEKRLNPAESFTQMNTEDDIIITLDNIFNFHGAICLATKTAPFTFFFSGGGGGSRITGEIVLAVVEEGTQLPWRKIIFRYYEHVESLFPRVNDTSLLSCWPCKPRNFKRINVIKVNGSRKNTDGEKKQFSFRGECRLNIDSV